MGQISSGIGLISGINTADLIDQLLAIEARPQQLLQQRVGVLTAEQTAFQGITAKLLVSKLSTSRFVDTNIFDSTTASSSNESVITASSGTSATPGTYDFTVGRLTSGQQFITNGFVDQDTTAVAPSGATLTFEFADAHLGGDTDLERLNGFTGVQRGKIRITDRSDTTDLIDLSQALTVNDVIKAINGAPNIQVTATVDGDGFVLTDNTGSTTTNLSVAEVNKTTAASLGLNVAAVGDVLTGSAVNIIGGSTPLSALNDSNGVRVLTAQDDIRVTRQDSTTFDVDLASATTINDVINLVNTASGGDVTAVVNTTGTGLNLVDTTVGPSTLAVAALNSSSAAADLGILTTDVDMDGTLEGSRVIAVLNSRLIKNLNGGTGIGLGTVDITNRAGMLFTVDFSNDESFDDIIESINTTVTNVTASVNNAGNGINLLDTTGPTVSNLIVTDVSSTTAADLNIAGSFAANSVDSGNLQQRHISEATPLSSLNGGKGISQNSFVITDSNGKSATVDLSQGNEKLIDDVLKEINSRGLALTALVNANGDGILLQDTGSGASALKVEEAGSSTAEDLGLLGTAANPGDDLNGSFERSVTIAATDTLDDVVTAINDADIGALATVINDGSVINPFRLSLSSVEAGRAGRFLFDDAGLNFGATTLNEANDSVVFFGAADPADGIAISSSSNTLSNVISGATINLLATSTSPVQVTIAHDDSAIEDAIQRMVDDVNGVIDTIDGLDTFNAETEERGLLLGDPTAGRIRSGLFSQFNSKSSDVKGQFTFASQVGIRVSGGNFQFDRDRFRSSLASDRAAVEQFFTLHTTQTNSDGEVEVTAAGFGSELEQLLDRYTDSIDGTLQIRVDTLQRQINLSNDRIDQLGELLESKRARLQTEFVAMERALANLQAQNAALVGFQPALQSFS